MARKKEETDVQRERDRETDRQTDEEAQKREKAVDTDSEDETVLYS